jgi:5-formyltetrahydrofolate cyclo-ligase
MLAKRNALTGFEIYHKSMQIQEILTRSRIFERSKVLGVYIAYGSEVRTRMIIEAGFRTNKVIGVPKVIDPNIIKFYQVHDFTTKSLCNGKYGISEPKETTKDVSEMIDLLIVPGLAFDTRGYRLGHGRGYYDRFLTEKRNMISIGLAFDFQLAKTQTLPHTRDDMKIDKIVTETGIHCLALDCI